MKRLKLFGIDVVMWVFTLFIIFGPVILVIGLAESRIGKTKSFDKWTDWVKENRFLKWLR